MNWLDSNYLPWLIPVPPLLAFLLIILITGRNKFLSHTIAMVGITISWVISWGVVLNAISFRDLGLTSRGVFQSSVTWLSNGSQLPGLERTGALSMGIMIDPLNTVMLFMVPLACLLIFVYALGYMANDPRQTRFFAYLSLFAGAMLTLVVADNLLLLFVGWEVMGLCSYLLIGFWYEKPSAYRAAMKAFMTTRVGDVIMMIGIAYLWSMTGTLNFRDILHNEEVLVMLGSTPAIGGFLGLSAAGLIGICIVFGTIGKSAQFPLHVWLPDAMEGPTPVSAMIHAAAMVSAGIYLIVRMFPVLSAQPELMAFEEGLLTAPMVLMAVVGSFTALFAATIATAQNDIKKVLAYSTISQLGFMMAALGIGAYVAAFFHLITHAFFKALLFLGSGSVIHAMEHGHHHAEHAHGHGDGHGDEHTADDVHAAVVEHAHDDHEEAHDTGTEGTHDTHEVEHAPAAPAFDPQDMRNMGGLFRRIPVTAITFIIGGASLMGFPLITAGFWSKDEILADAVKMSRYTPIAVIVLIFLSLAAILTAFYTFRQIVLTFFGSARSEAAVYAGITDGTPPGRRMSIQMQAPLVVLAVFAIIAGFAGVNPGFPVIGPLITSLGYETPFGNWVSRTLVEPIPHPPFNIVPVLISFAVFGVGVAFGWLLYGRKPILAGQQDALVDVVGTDMYRVLQNKWYIDEFYNATVIRASKWIADKFVAPVLDQGIFDGILHGITRASIFTGNLFREFNRIVIDGISDGIPDAIAGIGQSLRALQSGKIQQYMLYGLIAALFIGGNAAILLTAPGLVGVAFAIQAFILVVLVFFFGSGGQRRSEQ